jgi:hypothetical protein
LIQNLHVVPAGNMQLHQTPQLLHG